MEGDIGGSSSAHAGSPGLGELQAGLGSADPVRRVAAARSARELPGAEQALIASLADPVPAVRQAVVVALSRVGGPKGIRAIIRAAAQDPASSVRAEAMLSLGRILHTRGRPGDVHVGVEGREDPIGG